MERRIEYFDNCDIIKFAAEELARYLGQMDSSVPVVILQPDGPEQVPGTIKLMVGDSHVKLPGVENPELDDAYYIDINGDTGIIAGVNARSVLLGVYRYLRELGCRWVRPGLYGEIIPQVDILTCSVKCSEAASYRHRGVCIEGACSFTHVMDMIVWMPKIGLNAYYNQFFVPFTFFDRWYRHEGNPYMQPEELSVNHVQAMVNEHVAQIKKRGMLYHATGHGWTCEPLGIEGNSWEQKDYFVPDDVKDFLAKINGKREIFEKISLNTNLCYSNPEVQNRVVSAIVDYCLEHGEVDYLHFWLADGLNNHCECENCVKKLPSDFYVQMLNEIDRRLTLEQLETKIVFLIYVDLLWEPQTEFIKNKKRFVLMFAPITRTYTNTFCDDGGSGADCGDGGIGQNLKPYERNKLEMPKNVGENIQRLKKWQEKFDGDSFDYDYHLIWDFNLDPGGYSTARILFEDMKNLDKLGLNGMISCQCQRVFFPTGLSMYAMSEALWNKNLSFEEVASAYYSDMFGDCGGKMQVYFENLTRLFDPAYLRGEKPVVSEENAEKFSKVSGIVNEMLPFFHDSLKSEKDTCRKKSWQALIVHGQLCTGLSEALEQRARGNSELAKELWANTKDYIHRMEPEIHDLFDVLFFVNVMERVISDKPPTPVED